MVLRRHLRQENKYQHFINFSYQAGSWHASQRRVSSENRIKEIKNMCYAARLSNHSYWANFLRLLIRCLAYELFVLLKQAIRKATIRSAYRWQIDTIRSRLLKVGATIHKTKRRIYYQLSKAFVRQALFRELIAQ